MSTIPWEFVFAGLAFAIGTAIDLRRPSPTRGRRVFDEAARRAREAKESGERERPAAE